MALRSSMWVSSAWLCLGPSSGQRHLWNCCSRILDKRRKPSSRSWWGRSWWSRPPPWPLPHPPQLEGQSLFRCQISSSVWGSNTSCHCLHSFRSALWIVCIVQAFAGVLSPWWSLPSLLSVLCGGLTASSDIPASSVLCVQGLSPFRVAGTGTQSEWAENSAGGWGTYCLNGRRVSVKKYMETSDGSPLRICH